MTDLLMPDGSSQCWHSDCSSLVCGKVWMQMWANRQGSSMVGTFLVTIFFLLLVGLFFVARRNKLRAFMRPTNSQETTVLTTTYQLLLNIALVWAVLSVFWYVLAAASWIPHNSGFRIFLVIVHAILQMLKIFLHTFTFLSLCTDQLGMASLRCALFIALFWAISFGCCELMALNMSTYWEYFPYIRISSNALHTVLYTTLTIRYHLRGATVLTIPKAKRHSSYVSPVQFPLKRNLDSVAVFVGSGSRDDLEEVVSDNKHSKNTEDKPLLEAIRYWRPLHPFGILTLIYITISTITSWFLISKKEEYSCTLAIEAFLLYAVFPLVFYTTLLADSKLCQNLFEREEGYLNLVRVGVGQLKLGHVISGGSAGTVVKAMYNNRAVCVKKYVVSCLHVENLRKFEMEASLLGKLEHPNVVKVIGICNDNPYLYLVMEYCPGGDLYSYIHNPVKVLDFRFALSFMKDIASALAYVHSKGIIHRDIKSLNILLDSNMRAQLADFELSHFVGTMKGNNSLEKIAGTLAWLSPELVYGVSSSSSIAVTGRYNGFFSFHRLCSACCVAEEEDHGVFASDIYAFGVIMYELLTRKDPPLSDKKLKQLLEKSVENSFDPANFTVEKSHDGTIVPQRLQKLLLQCVQIAPAKRPTFAFISKELEEIEESLDA